MKKPLLLTLAAAILAAGTLSLMSHGSHTVDRPEVSASERLRLPDLKPRHSSPMSEAEYRKANDAVIACRNEIAASPEKFAPYVRLAGIYMQEARTTGEHHLYIPAAESLLDAVLRKDSSNFEAMIMKASILMTLHQFERAKSVAERAAALNSYSSFAYGILCDANVELGRYDDAIRACDRMVAVRPDLRSYARVSYQRELHGDRAGAIDAMKMALDAGVPGQENRMWVAYNLGNLYLNGGHLDTAEHIYKAILEERPDYGFAMAGLAAVHSARREYSRAIEELVRASQMMPEHIFIERLADIYRAMGQTESARTMEEKVLAAFIQHERDGWNIDREYAQFCADHDIHLDEAVNRARRELGRRPDNIDALQTYAWTLYKTGHGAEAIPYIERARRLDSTNAALNYYAGMIYHADGQERLALRRLGAAVRVTPYLTPLSRDTAERTLASLRGIASK